MKKLASLLLVLAVFLSLGTVAFADGTTKLTTTVPAATYTLNIPADQVIEFNATKVDIGKPTISDPSGFAEGKNVKITVATTPFTATGVSTTIPFTLKSIYTYHVSGTYGGASYNTTGTNEITSNTSILFKGKSDGTLSGCYVGGNTKTSDTWKIYIESTDWGKALGGDYTATITFTSEVVADTDNT